jgi:hypothetical protein
MVLSRERRTGNDVIMIAGQIRDAMVQQMDRGSVQFEDQVKRVCIQAMTRKNNAVSQSTVIPKSLTMHTKRHVTSPQRRCYPTTECCYRVFERPSICAFGTAFSTRSHSPLNALINHQFNSVYCQFHAERLLQRVHLLS